MNRFKLVSKILNFKHFNHQYIKKSTSSGSKNIFSKQSFTSSTTSNSSNIYQRQFYSTFSQQNSYKNQYQFKNEYQFKYNNQQQQQQDKQENKSRNLKEKKYRLGVLLSPTLLFSSGTTSISETTTPTLETPDIVVECKTGDSPSVVSSVNNTNMVSPDISCTSNETSVTLEEQSSNNIIENMDKMKVDEETVDLELNNNNNQNNFNNHQNDISSSDINQNGTNEDESNLNSESYHLHAGICVIPHPNKRHKGGEDAHFISQDRRVIGVADGVGGWGDVGIDPREYSNTLMEGSKLASDSASVTRDPLCIMEHGYIFSQDVKGSSTCCIVLVDGTTLLSANLGDSGFLVIRGSEIIFRTREQQHAFNMPYQLGTQSIDRPIHSITAAFEIEKGDLIVMGTDGVFDNLFDDEILEISEKGSEPQIIARMIAKRAFEIGCSTTNFTPFAKNAGLNGYIYTGGKLDDITVIVGIVSEGPLKPLKSDMLLLDEEFKNDEY